MQVGSGVGVIRCYPKGWVGADTYHEELWVVARVVVVVANVRAFRLVIVIWETSIGDFLGVFAGLI